MRILGTIVGNVVLFLSYRLERSALAFAVFIAIGLLCSSGHASAKNPEPDSCWPGWLVSDVPGGVMPTKSNC